MPDAVLIDLAAERRISNVTTGAAVVDQAIEHRMAGLLWSAVERGDVTVSADDRTRLARIDLAYRQHHRRLQAAMCEVQRRAAAVDLRLASFKGITAAARWYDRPSERHASDLDVWLDPAQRDHGARLLAALAPDFDLDRRTRAALERGRLPVLEVPLAMDMDADEDAVTIDVHFDLLRLGVEPRDARALWSGVRPLSMGDDLDVLVLTPEVALLQALLHTNRDRFRYLSGYADVARIIHRESIDWQTVWQLADREGAEVPVYETLSVITQTLGLAWPAPSPTPPRGWRPRTWRRLWGPRQRLLGASLPGGDRRRLRFLPILVRGVTPATVAAWLRGSL